MHVAMPTESHYDYSNHDQIPFQHVQSLGFGSYGTVDAVKRSSDSQEAKLYARKVFFLTRAANLDKILQEIKIARNLKHEHIVRLVETYQCKLTYAMIMEPVADGNLEYYLSSLDDTSEHVYGEHRTHLSR
jgi:serine/threonine protein kinase